MKKESYKATTISMHAFQNKQTRTYFLYTANERYPFQSSIIFHFYLFAFIEILLENQCSAPLILSISISFPCPCKKRRPQNKMLEESKERERDLTYNIHMIKGNADADKYKIFIRSPP